MAFVPLPNGISLCFLFSTAGQQWQFCLTLRKSAGAPTTEDLDTVAGIGSDWWSGNLQSNLNTSTTLGAVKATDMTAQGAPQAVVAVNTAGSVSGMALPLGTALVLSHRTAKRGRSYRGRTFLGGLSTSNQTNAVDATSGTLSTLGTVFAALQSALDTAGFDLVVPSRRHNGVATNPAELNEVVATVIDSHFDSQRRRLAGRGV